MDPVIIVVVVLFLLVLAIRIFFGMAKLLLKIGVIVVIAVVLWRLFAHQ